MPPAADAATGTRRGIHLPAHTMIGPENSGEPTMDAKPPYSAARRLVFWIVVAAAGVVLVLSAIETFTADPHEGEGWIGGPIQAIFAGGPLVAVSIGLRSIRRKIAKRTAVASLLLALVAAFVLVMQLLDPNETTSDRLWQAVAILVYLASFAVELPAFTRRWPPPGNAAIR